MKKQVYFLLPLMALAVAGCNSDSGSSNSSGLEGNKPYVQTTVDASDYNQWQFYNLDNGSLVDEQANWHIAFKRFDVRLHPDVQGAIGDEQTTYYDNGSPVTNAFVNADAGFEEQTLYAVQDDSVLNFESSGAAPYIDTSWYSYNPATHSLTANSDNYWILRSAAGNSYALMHEADIDAAYNATFEFYVQAPDEDSFAGTSVSTTVSLTSDGQTCYDFDADANVACTSDDWDLMFDISGHNYRLWVNGGAGPDGMHDGDAAAYGIVADDDYEAGSDVVVHAFSQDQFADVFNNHSWYEYGINGGHGIWPNFRVYVVDTDSSDDQSPLIKLQIINYYDESGTSGHITWRYMDLSDAGN